MVKFLLEKGIDSISVNADKAKEISDYVAELEKNFVAGTDKEPRRYEENKNKIKKEATSPNISDKEKKRIERDIEAIEEEKRQYIKEHPNETESDSSYSGASGSVSQGEDETPEKFSDEELDENPEFSSEDRISEELEQEFETILK